MTFFKDKLGTEQKMEMQRHRIRRHRESDCSRAGNTSTATVHTFEQMIAFILANY